MAFSLGEFMQKVRTGIGFDVHKLVEGRDCIIGGVKIDHPKGLLGHSDADVLAHAISDAILGAAGLGDIGTHFSDKDPRWKGADSMDLLAQCGALVREHGWTIEYIDAVVMCEEPRIKPHREAMMKRMSEVLQLDLDQVHVKGTTTEKLGFTGRSEGIAAQAVATIFR